MSLSDEETDRWLEEPKSRFFSSVPPLEVDGDRNFSSYVPAFKKLLLHNRRESGVPGWNGFAVEFQSLNDLDRGPLISNPLPAQQDRYRNILVGKQPMDAEIGQSVSCRCAVERSRVKLASMEDGGYINANYVDFPRDLFLPGTELPPGYIASQAPLPSTMAVFWQMVWENRCPVIVMLTRLREGFKVKADRYWPSEVGQVVEHGALSVKLIHAARTNTPLYRVRFFELEGYNEDGELEQRGVIHLHYEGWPDFGVPSDTSFLPILLKHIELISNLSPAEVRALGYADAQERVTFWDLYNSSSSRSAGDDVEEEWFMGAPGSGPTVVHCSAGVGRTGVLVALDTLHRLLVNYRVLKRVDPVLPPFTSRRPCMHLLGCLPTPVSAVKGSWNAGPSISLAAPGLSLPVKSLLNPAMNVTAFSNSQPSFPSGRGSQPSPTNGLSGLGGLGGLQMSTERRDSFGSFGSDDPCDTDPWDAFDSVSATPAAPRARTRNAPNWEMEAEELHKAAEARRSSLTNSKGSEEDLTSISPAPPFDPPTFSGVPPISAPPRTHSGFTLKNLTIEIGSPAGMPSSRASAQADSDTESDAGGPQRSPTPASVCGAETARPASPMMGVLQRNRSRSTDEPPPRPRGASAYGIKLGSSPISTNPLFPQPSEPGVLTVATNVGPGTGMWSARSNASTDEILGGINYDFIVESPSNSGYLGVDTKPGDTYSSKNVRSATNALGGRANSLVPSSIRQEAALKTNRSCGPVLRHQVDQLSEWEEKQSPMSAALSDSELADHVSILKVVQRLRQQRVKMVMKQEQYCFLYAYIQQVLRAVEERRKEAAEKPSSFGNGKPNLMSPTHKSGPPSVPRMDLSSLASPKPR